MYQTGMVSVLTFDAKSKNVKVVRCTVTGLDILEPYFSYCTIPSMGIEDTRNMLAVFYKIHVSTIWCALQKLKILPSIFFLFIIKISHHT